MNFKKLFILTIIFISLIGIVTGIVPNPGHSWAQLEMPSLTATFPNIVANNNIYARAGILNDQTANGGMVYIGDIEGLRLNGDLEVNGNNINSGTVGGLYLDPDSDGHNTVYIGGSSTDVEGDDLMLPDGYLKVCSGGSCPTASTAQGDGELFVEGDLEVDGSLDINIRQARFDCDGWPTVTCSREAGSDTSIGLGYHRPDFGVSIFVDMVCPAGYIAIAGGGWCNPILGGFNNIHKNRPLINGIDTVADNSTATPSRAWRIACGNSIAEINGGSITCARIQ